MALKRPVVTTDAGGTRECIRDCINGLLIRRGDREALSSSLSRLYRDDGLRVRLAEAGYQTILSQFSLDRMRDELVTFCREVVNGRVRPVVSNPTEERI